MKRILLLAIVSLTLALPAVAKKNIIPVGGSYKSWFGNNDGNKFDLTLIQDGKTVTGFYMYNDGKLEGTLKDRRLTGTWTEKEESGRFTIVFNIEANSFSGYRSYGDKEPDEKCEQWFGEMDTRFGHGKAKPDKNVWVLAGKETVISHSSFTTDNPLFDADPYLGGANPPVTYTLSGTAEDFTVGLSCDFSKGFINAAEQQDSYTLSFSASAKGGFQPPLGSYAAGEDFIGSYVCTQDGSIPGNVVISYGTPCCITSLSIGGIDGVVFEEGNYRNVFDSNYESIYLHGDYGSPTVFGNEGSANYSVYFPNPEYYDGGEDFYLCLEVRFKHGPDDEFDYIATVYHYKWNGDDYSWGTTDTAGWFREIFGDGPHTDDLWTIFISGGAAALAIGALAGMLGGPAGGGAAGASGPGGGPGTGPADDRKKHPFGFRPDDPSYVLRNVRPNDDGTLTLKDPAGGPDLTLIPTFDDDGNPTGWISENNVEYSDDDIREWARSRSENSEVLKQDTAQAEQNLAEQRAQNEARDAADRERGSTATADEVRDWEHHQETIQRLADKFGVNPEDEEALKNAIRKDMIRADMEGGIAEGDAAWWDERIAEAKLVESTSDTIINTVGETSPGAKVIKNSYGFFKSLGQHTMEGITEGGGAGHVTARVAQGFVEGGINVIQNEAGNDKWGNFARIDKWTGGETGRSVGGEVLKTVMNDVIEGTDTSEAITNAAKAGLGKFASDKAGKIISGKAEEIFNKTAPTIDLNAPGGIENLASAYQDSLAVGSVGGELITQTLTNPVTEIIADDLGEWRESLLGI